MLSFKSTDGLSGNKTIELKHIGSRLLTALVAGALALPSLAQPRYEAIDLGTLQNGEANSWAWDVNELGEVVGYADAPNKKSIHAFLWSAGTMVDLKTLGTPYSWAFGINNSKQITGYSGVSSVTIHGFFWEDGVMNDIGGAPFGRGGFSRGNDINEAGVIVGISHSSRRDGIVVPYTGFIWDAGEWTELPSFGGGDGHAYGMNDRNDVVGWAEFEKPLPQGAHGALWVNAEIVDLGSLGEHHSFAEDVNNRREVVGYSINTEGNIRAFHWHNRVLTELEDLGGAQSWAYRINDRGQIAGSSEDATGERRAMLVDTDGSVYDLNDLVEPGLDVVFHGARSINELGQIATSAELPDGTRHAFLLTPTTMLALGLPEPGIAGELNRIEIANVTPGAKVLLGYGMIARHTAVGFCDLTISLGNPQLVGSAVADQDGVAVVDIFVPKFASGLRVFMQALEVGECDASNLVRFTFD